MHVDLIPTLFDQMRETIEGSGGSSWIGDGKPEVALFGTIDALTPQQAMAAPTPGGKSIAGHVAHLRYMYDLTTERLADKDPKSAWETSFDLADPSPAGWDALKRDVRRAWQTMVMAFEAYRGKPIQDWPPIIVAGLTAQIGHNAYHVGAIRQILRVVSKGAS